MANEILESLMEYGFDTVEELESDIAAKRQKLDAATMSGQLGLMKSLSQKLAERESLQKRIAGRARLP